VLRRLGRRLFAFEGRLARGDFWQAALFTGFAFVVLLVFLEDTLGRRASLVLYPPLFWIAASLGLRRMHDRGRSAASLLWLLVPLLGPLLVFVELGLRRGTPGPNQYGPDPLTT